jgi:transcription elongation factor Elf1
MSLIQLYSDKTLLACPYCNHANEVSCAGRSRGNGYTVTGRTVCEQCGTVYKLSLKVAKEE